MKILVFMMLVLFSLVGNSQQFCHTDEMHQDLFMENLTYHNAITNSFNQLEIETRNFSSSNRASGNYIIPVVFHVIHQNGIENISDEQIKDQIAILNRDFGSYDTTVIIDSFKSIVANCEIEFRLATIDPSGNCTDGITRHVSNLTLTGDHAVKSIEHWPPNMYLNFYVVANAAGLAGHALLPYAADSLPHWDGIVMSHNSIGSIGTSNVQRSVVGSHEVGHYFNLQHVWGGNNVPNFPYLPVSSGGNCSYDDGVGDTPNTIGNQSCNLTANSCGSLDNVQNFMDYSYCGAMFTVGQKNRMHACLNSSVANRNNLWSPTNLVATGTDTTSTVLCAADFDSDRLIVCEGDTITFWDKSYHKITNRTWDFYGGVATSISDSITKVSYASAGNYNVKLVVSNGIDSDSVVKSLFITVVPLTGSMNFLLEDFESLPAFPNSKWNTAQIDSNWKVQSNVGYNSSASLKYNNFDNSGKVELTSTTIDASGYSAMEVQFNYAYAEKESSSTDKLNVYYSKDCGETWTLRRSYPSISLLTNFTNDSLPFVPNGTGDWTYSNLSIYNSFLVSNLQVKFEFTGSSKGNNFYLDNINILDPATASVNEQWQDGVSIYPNPTKDVIYLDNIIQGTKITLLDVTGKKINEIVSYDRNEKLSLESLKPGVYFIKLTHKGIAFFTKIVKQ